MSEVPPSEHGNAIPFHDHEEIERKAKIKTDLEHAGRALDLVGPGRGALA
jgi:hypothetical protein